MYKRFLLPLLTLVLAGSAFAQTLESMKFYKLDFVVKEVEAGKTVNSRFFSTLLSVATPGSNSPQASIRSGGRVPYSTGGGTQYYDLGVNLDLRDLRDSPTDISVQISADISTVVQENPAATPVVRQNRWQGAVIAPIKKPTIVFASDDLSTKRQLQLEITATPVKP